MLLYWVWFSLLKLSSRQKNMLLEQYSDPEELYNTQDTQALHELLGDRDLTAARRVLADCREKGIGAVGFSDAEYPARLRNIPDPPFVLYYLGQLPDWKKAPAVGVVGTRKASGYGMQLASRFGCQIAGCGGLVVSGVASGVDTAAMLGAICVGAPTVGVLGCGVDIVYPKVNRPVYEKILEDGCLLSEYVPGTAPASWNFPARNRIISGISDGVLVVEAPAKSGALITARDAMEQGRDVFAVPGNLGVASCEGSNALLQEGAMAALSGWDVVKLYESKYENRVKKWQPSPEQLQQLDRQAQMLTGQIPQQSQPGQKVIDKKDVDKEEKSSYSVLDNIKDTLDPEERAVVAALTTTPQDMDVVLSKLELPAGKVLTILTRLSLRGIVKYHPGKRVSL